MSSSSPHVVTHQDAPAGIDPRGPRFVAGIVTVLAIVTLLLGTGPGALAALAVLAVSFGLGVAAAVPVAAALVLVASFLNAVFGLCLGCELYLLGVRLRAARA